MSIKSLLPIFIGLVIALPTEAQEYSKWHKWAESNPDWVTKTKPFNVISNVYYVGTQGIAAYLIVGDDGHILIDGGMPQSAKQIAGSIEQLGYRVSDVKYLLNTHAHFDHSGGLAELRQLTGAKLISSEQDAHWLESGLYPGRTDDAYASAPVTVDIRVSDNDSVVLGDLSLQARLTPGHSPGCTSWVFDVLHKGQKKTVIVFGGASVAGNKLAPEEQYPGIIQDYQATFNKVKSWSADVYLSNHPFYFHLQRKRLKREAGDEEAFIDEKEFAMAMKKFEVDFYKRLAEQRGREAK